MNNGKQPISPTMYTKNGSGADDFQPLKDGQRTGHEVKFGGLTKLEYFTAMAMQGILSNSPDWSETDLAKDWVAKNSVEYAVKTLAQLEDLNE